MPAASIWTGQESYADVLGNGPRILIANFIAFLTSQSWDVFVYSELKTLSRGR